MIKDLFISKYETEKDFIDQCDIVESYDYIVINHKRTNKTIHGNKFDFILLLKELKEKVIKWN